MVHINFNNMRFWAFLITTFLLIACGSETISGDSKTNEEISLSKKKDSLERLLTDQYSLSYSLDTIQKPFSIEFGDVLASGKQLITLFRIHDIYKPDSTIYAKIGVGILNRLFLTLKITENQYHQLMTIYDQNAFRTRAFLVVEIDEIKKEDYSLTAYEGDQGQSSMELLLSKKFRGKGRIIEVVPWK